MSKILPNVLEDCRSTMVSSGCSVGIENINDLISDLESALKSPG
jgi:O-acetylhomoserine/O-acetylserine sulfhydrylase-like pyridoxal-dependent enzyme